MKKYWFLLVIALATVTLFTQCTSEDEDEVEIVLEVDSNGYAQFNQNALRSVLNDLPKQSLTAEEEAGIIFMREEEKLAHDVYTHLFQNWNNRVFDHIAASELTHTEAVLLLIDKYALTDPVGSNGTGVFVDNTLQQLYDDLTVAGNVSEIEGLKVGAAIEEIDILDLQVQLDNVVDNQDITMVYENLQKGSRNHLRAFVKNLTNRGIIYDPQYLSQDKYDQIINGNMETGR